MQNLNLPIAKMSVISESGTSENLCISVQIESLWLSSTTFSYTTVGSAEKDHG